MSSKKHTKKAKVVKSSSDDPILDEEVWTAINAFFEENGLNSAQIQSYNDLIYHKIHKSIEHLKHLKIEENDKCYKIEFGELIFHPPQFTETDDSTHTLYPMEALWRNITYASEIYVDVTITPPTGEATLYEKVYIGNIPVMVKSDLCNISGIVADPEKLARHSEDLFDQGGYFVIAPKSESAAGSTAQRRALVPQERSAPNRVFIFSNRKARPKYKTYAEVRSTGNGIHTTTTTVGYLNQKLTCVLPWIDAVEIPLGVVFRALGIDDEKEMAMLCLGPSYADDHRALDILSPTLEHSYECDNQDAALHFIGRRGRKFMKEEETGDEHPDDADDLPHDEEEQDISRQEYKDRDDAVSYARHLLAIEFLPHVGHGEETFKDKAKFLGYMVHKEIDVLLDRRKPEDRDHVMNKVVITTGALLGQQFFGAFRRLTTEIINNTRKALRNGHTVNITSWIKPNIITNAMHGAISTNAWNTGGATAKGISQLYEQFNFAAGIANMRKLSVPMAAEGGRSIFPRDLHQSHIFLICPSETPEGKNAGLVKNMAMMCFITIDTNPTPVRDAALALLGDAAEQYPMSLGWVKVFLNGALIGETETPKEFVQSIRNLRRRNNLNSQTSVAYFAKTGEIHMSTEAGRLTRPLFVVENGALTFTLGLAKKLLNHEISWTELLTTGTVELIDKCEEESMNIAGYPSDFEKMADELRLQYTHCEMHPSLMFGVGGSIIPFPDHNQSPRNTYQCLWKEEPVLMGTGEWRKIKDLKIGDEIMTFDPRTLKMAVTTVVHAHVAKTQKRIVQLTTQTGRKIVVTEDHKIMTLGGWQEAGKLSNQYVAVYRGNKSIGFDLIQTIQEMENVEIADITTKSENHSFIGGAGFCVHNSAMGKQAIGIPFTNYRQMMSGTFHTLQYLQKPLALSRAASIIGFDEMPAGQNAMVAVLPRPFNEEDSIEINQDSIDRGFMVSDKWICYYAEVSEEKNEFFGIPTEETCFKHRGDPSKLLPEGYPKPGTQLKDGDIVIGKMSTPAEDDSGEKKKNNNKSLIYDHSWPSVVDHIQIGTTGDGYEYVRVTVCQRREPVVGDKFAARHGQKGTVGAKPRSVDLPFTRGGMVPDIIMNSLAFPSRMTIAMLVELWTGKVVSSASPLHEVTFADYGIGSGGMDAEEPEEDEDQRWKGIASAAFKAAFSHPKDPKIIDATPFRKPFSINIIREEMKKYGMEFGDEYMTDGITGKPLRALIFYAPGYYQKLKHMVIDKMHARARGGRTTLTRQPKEGRAAGGGLRTGCMERDCILGQGAARFGRDRLMEQSDEFRMWVCSICGLPAHVEKQGEIKECRVCGTNKVAWVRIPYGTKLITQEMMAMNIVPRMLTTGHSAIGPDVQDS